MPHSPEIRPGIWAAIAAVFRQNRIPCVLLNLLVVLLVSSYYMVPRVAAAWVEVGAFKTRWGYLFSGVSGMVSAALLPYLLQRLMGKVPGGGGGSRLAWLALFWGYRGVEVDVFYKFQGWLFGQDGSFRTLASKVVMDQFIYSVVWAAPSYVILLRWLDHGRSWSRTIASLDKHFWSHTYPTVIVTNWLVWVPVVCLVYSLPTPLQFPLFTVVMCFFVLIVTLLAGGTPKAELLAES